MLTLISLQKAATRQASSTKDTEDDEVPTVVTTSVTESPVMDSEATTAEQLDTVEALDTATITEEVAISNEPPPADVPSVADESVTEELVADKQLTTEETPEESASTEVSAVEETVIEEPATEETPATAEETPAATEEAPAATEEAPAATEEAPAATEEAPAVSDAGSLHMDVSSATAVQSLEDVQQAPDVEVSQFTNQGTASDHVGLAGHSIVAKSNPKAIQSVRTGWFKLRMIECQLHGVYKTWLWCVVWVIFCYRSNACFGSCFKNYEDV